MNISKNIPINADDVLKEIAIRQGAPWNNGRINDYYDFPNLAQLFKLINSGIPQEDFFYTGDLFRIHTSYSGHIDSINPEKEFPINKPCKDGSCSILQFTEYSKRLVAFSKTPDFTKRDVFYKVIPDQKVVIIHTNTKSFFGIDVNKLQERFGVYTRYSGELEILFPLLKEFVVKEYLTTPNKAKYYLKKYI